MIVDLKNKEYVRGLKECLHKAFDNPQGEEIMNFLEVACGWYHSVFSPQSHDMTLINDGKRQVLATIKTILTLSPEQISELAKQKEGL